MASSWWAVAGAQRGLLSTQGERVAARADGQRGGRGWHTHVALQHELLAAADAQQDAFALLHLCLLHRVDLLHGEQGLLGGTGSAQPPPLRPTPRPPQPALCLPYPAVAPVPPLCDPSPLLYPSLHPHTPLCASPYAPCTPIPLETTVPPLRPHTPLCTPCTLLCDPLYPSLCPTVTSPSTTLRPPPPALPRPRLTGDSPSPRHSRRLGKR